MLIMLANYTLRPLGGLTLQLQTIRPVDRVESVQHGTLSFDQPAPGMVRWEMPLEASDYIKVWTK
jgi:hypothetical protein